VWPVDREVSVCPRRGECARHRVQGECCNRYNHTEGHQLSRAFCHHVHHGPPETIHQNKRRTTFHIILFLGPVVLFTYSQHRRASNSTPELCNQCREHDHKPQAQTSFEGPRSQSTQRIQAQVLLSLKAPKWRASCTHCTSPQLATKTLAHQLRGTKLCGFHSGVG
jgi:hypothetical protein